MVCDECGRETDTIYEVHGYAGIYSLCGTCFGPAPEDEEADVTTFVKKPERLEAIQWSGSNWHAVQEFAEKVLERRAVYVDGSSDLYVRALPPGMEDKFVAPRRWLIFRGPFSGIEIATDEELHKDWEEEK